MNTGDDLCPGDQYVLNPGDHLLLAGDTSTASQDYQAFLCADANGPDRVYWFSLPPAGPAGTLTVALTPTNPAVHDPAMYFRDAASCTAASNESYCSAFWSSQESIAIEAGAGVSPPFGPHIALVVGGEVASAGEYLLDVQFQPATCGDEAINLLAGETCDDGNLIDGDGCGATCQNESASVIDICGGGAAPIPLVPNVPVVQSHGNWGAADDYVFQSNLPGQICPFDPFPGGRDQVHTITPQSAGTVTATIGFDPTNTIDVCEQSGFATAHCWDRVLYAVGPDDCDVDSDGILDSPQLACSDATALGPETITFPVEAMKDYFIIVDAIFSSPTYFGAYNLVLELTP